MKTKFLKIVSVALCAVFIAIFFVGCNKGNKAQTGVLKITYYDGAYGNQWLKNALDKFVAEKKEAGKNISYELIAESNTSSAATTQLKSGKNLSDIYMMQSGNLTDYVSRGYLEPLTDVYEANVKTSTGEIKLKDYLAKDYASQYYMQRIYGQGENVPWAVPWSMSQIGLVYNENILKNTSHTTAKEGAWAIGDKWVNPPETVEDLLFYCADLNAAGITPFVFPGAEGHWLGYLIQVFWAQYQGVYNESANVTAGEGSFYDYWNFESMDVYKQEGIKKGIDVIQSLLFDLEKKDFKNSMANVNTYLVKDAERQFVQGQVAMLIGASFMYSEVKDFMADGIKFKMMSMPFIENADTNENGKQIVVNYYTSEDFMMVPKEATNKQLAKEFLVYLSNEEFLVDFTKLTGTLRPFNYNVKTILGDKFDTTFNDFHKSLFDVYDKSDIHLVSKPANINPEDRSVMSLYKSTSLPVCGVYNWATFIDNMKTKKSDVLMKEVYDKTLPEFNKWKEELGVD